MNRSWVSLGVATLCVVLAACGGNSDNGGTGGNNGAAGTTAAGGGGGSGNGGAGTTGAGGATSMGGTMGTGGSMATGGATGEGGAAGTGGATGTAGAGGRAGATGTAGAGGRAGTGGSGGAAGTAETGVCAGDPAPNPDVATSCNAANAKAGATCTQNCCLTCGIDSLGQETCTCSSANKKYATCDCPRPTTWTTLGGECGDSKCMTAGGPCSPQGYASATGAPAGANILDGQDCVMNGNVCFTMEADGNHGCVCASEPSGDFVMRCGLVNGWFTNNGTPTTY